MLFTMRTIDDNDLDRMTDLLNSDYSGFVNRLENCLRHVIHGMPVLFDDASLAFSVTCFVIAKADSFTNSLSFRHAMDDAMKRIYGFSALQRD